MGGHRAISCDRVVQGRPMRMDDDVVNDLQVLTPVIMFRLQRILLTIRVASTLPYNRARVHVLHHDLVWLSYVRRFFSFGAGWSVIEWLA